MALKTESAERSDVLVTKQLENIAVNGRSYLALAAMAPGVVSTGNFTVAGTGGLGNISANGARPNQNQLTLNGVSNVDTGNNGDQLATISLDSVQEYRILTGVYQAEYGRSSGAQISVVTKSGTSAFHGSGYYLRRHDSLNANDWLSNRDGRPRRLFRFNNPGYTIGGPVFIPGTGFNKNKDKLFFFWSQEYQDQLQPEGVRRVTVPTELERQGNFSQSVDRSGNKIFVRDYTLNLPCSAADTLRLLQQQHHPVEPALCSRSGADETAAFADGRQEHHARLQPRIADLDEQAAPRRLDPPRLESDRQVPVVWSLHQQQELNHDAIRFVRAWVQPAFDSDHRCASR